MGRGFARRKGAWKTAGDRSQKSEVRSQRSGGNRGQRTGDRGQRTVEAGKQETQENRKERMARMGNGGQGAEGRGQEETEDRGQGTVEAGKQERLEKKNKWEEGEQPGEAKKELRIKRMARMGGSSSRGRRRGNYEILERREKGINGKRGNSRALTCPVSGLSI